MLNLEVRLTCFGQFVRREVFYGSDRVRGAVIDRACAAARK